MVLARHVELLRSLHLCLPGTSMEYDIISVHLGAGRADSGLNIEDALYTAPRQGNTPICRDSGLAAVVNTFWSE